MASADNNPKALVLYTSYKLIYHQALKPQTSILTITSQLILRAFYNFKPPGAKLAI